MNVKVYTAKQGTVILTIMYKHSYAVVIYYGILQVHTTPLEQLKQLNEQPTTARTEKD